MKLKQLFLCIISLLFTSLLPAKVYADQYSQTMGSNNKNSPQINGTGNTVCNNCNFYNSETTSSVNQPNPSPKYTSPGSRFTSGGLEPKYTSPGSRFTSGGLEPKYTSPGSRSTSGGLEPNYTSPGSL